MRWMREHYGQPHTHTHTHTPCTQPHTHKHACPPHTTHMHTHTRTCIPPRTQHVAHTPLLSSCGSLHSQSNCSSVPFPHPGLYGHPNLFSPPPPPRACTPTHLQLPPSHSMCTHPPVVGCFKVLLQHGLRQRLLHPAPLLLTQRGLHHTGRSIQQPLSHHLPYGSIPSCHVRVVVIVPVVGEGRAVLTPGPLWPPHCAWDETRDALEG